MVAFCHLPSQASAAQLHPTTVQLINPAIMQSLKLQSQVCGLQHRRHPQPRLSDQLDLHNRQAAVSRPVSWLRDALTAVGAHLPVPKHLTRNVPLLPHTGNIGAASCQLLPHAALCPMQVTHCRAQRQKLDYSPMHRSPCWRSVCSAAPGAAGCPCSSARTCGGIAGAAAVACNWAGPLPTGPPEAAEPRPRAHPSCCPPPAIQGFGSGATLLYVLRPSAGGSCSALAAPAAPSPPPAPLMAAARLCASWAAWCSRTRCTA